MRRKDFRILWMSNAPFAPTGYGTVTKNICYRLLKQGYGVATVNVYGSEGGLLVLNGLRQYPRAFEQLGEDAAQLAILDYKPSVLVTLFDIWVGGSWLSNLHRRWCAYVPVDHKPVPPPVVDAARQAYRVISMSKYGEQQLTQAGVSNAYIPHGVDTKQYYPLPDKSDAKAWLDKLSPAKDPFLRHQGAKTFEPDSFIIGINAANKGPRKDMQRMLTVFKIFLDQNPDAKKDVRLYLHTWMRGVMKGFHLDDLAKTIGVLDFIRWTPTTKMYAGLQDNQMNVLYNSFDVFMNLAQGEGFGLPVIEAQACQVPVIAVDYTSMTELVDGHGWLIPVKDEHYTPLNAKQAFGDEWKAARALENAYNHPRKRRRLAKESRVFAHTFYDYERCILPLWMDFFDEMLVDQTTTFELKAIA